MAGISKKKKEKKFRKSALQKYLINNGISNNDKNNY